MRRATAGRDLALAYRGSRDGWSALAFHRAVDKKGPCVVAARTRGGARFGGFNPEGFQSSDDYRSSHKAFLYCWPATAGATSEPVILRKARASARTHAHNSDKRPCGDSPHE